MDERDRYEQGLARRRAVLGGAHVDRALARRSELTAEFQDLITRYAWGESQPARASTRARGAA